MLPWRTRTIRSDDVDLAVFELGDPANPPVVLVHGWPDSHHLWSRVAPLLARDHFVVAYDTRGYGASSKPSGVDAYHLDHLKADLFAVIDAVAGGRKAHVIAHDWGSLQAWEAVTTPGADDRIASYTSISGPNLDYLGMWSRRMLRHRTRANLREGLAQIASSIYIVFFLIPVITPALVRLLARPARWRRLMTRMEGVDPSQVELSDTFTDDAVTGLNYYRANIVRKLAHPDPRGTDIPVLELINGRDVALRPAVFSETENHVPNLRRRTSATGHWLPLAAPDYIAQNASELIADVER